ncbi:alpha/beta hydrolase [Erythrobacter sp.]|uniref:alpha/beta hydrolase n=1 Tax=Erythrobacter sp. TaxID=1042 RepID=UPI003C74EDEF
MRTALYIVGGIALTALLGWGALQVAVDRNGPAVLDTIDRIAGGERAATLVERASTGPHAQQKVLVWSPPGADRGTAPLPVIVFVHGGSWRDGDPDDYGFVARALVPEGFVVVLAGYRLGEAGRYPAMLEDTAAAIRWTRENIAAHGGDPQAIVLAGHSAGAYNVVTTALDTRWLEAEGVPPQSIAGVVGIAGPYDFLPFDSESTIAAFGHVEDPEQTQPVSHVGEDAPQMLLIHGEEDETVEPRNTRALTDRLEKAGGHALPLFFPGMSHSDPLIALAAPWRSRRSVLEYVAGYAHAVASKGETSFPVQGETR